MKKKLIVLGFVLLGVGTFASVLANTGWGEIWEVLQGMTPGKVALFLLVSQISFALFTLRWSIILKTHGHKLPFWRLWLYRATGYGVSYITPTQVGGEPARIYLLHENERVKLREATASVLLDKLIELSTFLGFVAAGVIVVSFTNLIPQQTLWSVLALLGGCTVLAGYIFKKLFDGSGFLTSTFKRMGFHKVKKLAHFEKKIHRTEKLIMKFLSHTDHKKTTFPLLVGISLLAWASTIVEYFVLAQFLGINLGAFQSFLVGTVPSMAYLLPVPGGLGVLEGAQVGMFGLLGYGPSLAFAVVMMVRVKELSFSIIGFAYALTHGLTLLGKEKPPKKKTHGVLSRAIKPRSISSHKRRSKKQSFMKKFHVSS